MTAEYGPGEMVEVPQADGVTLRLRKITPDYDPSDKAGALSFIEEKSQAGELATGLLYLDPLPKDLHANMNTAAEPLNTLTESTLCPGSTVLETINAALR
jgi:2-oxoglutarate ferredoxin oxidoreductase subunit beta